MTDTPNLDKMLAVKAESEVVQGFIDWLFERPGTRLYLDYPALTFTEHVSDRERERLLAMYFDVDLEACERERMAILDDLRDGHRQQRVLKRRKEGSRG